VEYGKGASGFAGWYGRTGNDVGLFIFSEVLKPRAPARNDADLMVLVVLRVGKRGIRLGICKV
jgi:hypothetical protein